MIYKHLIFLTINSATGQKGSDVKAELLLAFSNQQKLLLCDSLG